MKAIALSAALLLGFILPSFAQTPAPAWPTTKTVRIVVPFGPGSTPDMVGRILADDLQSRHPGTAFVIENKSGAGGNIGTDAVAKAAPDGATIGISLGGPLAINTLLFSKLPYDPAKDIATVTLLTSLPSVLVVPSSLNVNSAAEFVATVKRDPDKIAFGSIGAGSLSHLTMEAIAQRAGAKLTHIPYASSPQVVMAVIRGDVQAACLPAIAVTPQLAGGQVKILAVSTAQRSRFLPDVPTLKESGIDVESDAWNALIAPGGTPPAVIAEINKEVRATLTKPEVRTKLETQLIEPTPSSPEELRARVNAEIKLWADVIKAGNLRIN
ncbi:ABC transporter substrate-binding protein [Afipia sp. Root123D2]|uniref:Bug family tripartite tricarboxylate transporter substrate binding protein n=1 Tax=Afipia sp. Root123D2 TaxID=1736436 RepID=UPI0006FAFD30|nr:tripartite tricarboxylate transporter substrate binding protein [Afipia sp. Root123D2]KQW23284.1 ABC transporter substrate-binding protein [Afipia sp. Root123D2]